MQCTSIFGCDPGVAETKWPDANYGIGLQIVAPSYLIVSTEIGPNDNEFVYNNGTSDAAPVVSATLGLMSSVYPTLTSQNLEYVLLAKGVDKLERYTFQEGYPFGSWNEQLGYGRLNMYKALSNLVNPDLCINGPVLVTEHLPAIVTQNSLTVTCNSSTYEISSTGEIALESKIITLNPGFHADNGSHFLAIASLADDRLQMNNQMNLSTRDNKRTSESIENSKNNIPYRFSLFQNYPNPFNPVTEIRFSIATMGIVKLDVFDLLGRKVKSLVNELRQPGEYFQKWDATGENGESISSGVYFYRLECGTYVQTKKLVFIK